MTAAEPTAEALARSLDARRNGRGWVCRCPAHDDHNPSLSIEARGGKAVFICRAGCDQKAVIAALRKRGVWPEPEEDPKCKRKRLGPIVATYGYRDETGALRYQVLRYEPKDEPKTFRQRRPNGTDGGFIWNTNGVTPLPYRLPDLLADRGATVFIVEGEKDVDNLAEIGILATCNTGGAVREGEGKWQPEISRWFAGRNVVIVPDNDEPGRAHARDVAAKLAGIAASIRILELPGLQPKGDVSDWIDQGGDAAELERLADAVAVHVTNPIGDPGKARVGPEITVRAGERHKAADEGIAALQAAGVAFYQRGSELVRVCDVRARSMTGEVIMVPGIAAVTPAILERALGQTATWQRLDAKKAETVRIDPPRPVVVQILDMVGEWPFPPLTGVIGCPTLRHDGSLLNAEGYDLATGLALRSTVPMPQISEFPTRRDAETAIALLMGLLEEFPFADQGSKAVALSMIMTPVLRGAMLVAPMHLVTAPEAGTGKSYLADTASVIATGERIATVAVAPSPEETEKRLVGAALAGHPLIGLDNCREILEGDFLCQITERPLLQLRALGKSDQIRVNNSFTVFANGNNVAVAEDLVRRTIRCALDANMENPETRTFRGNPLATVRRDRGAYIAAVLTIARAYIATGRSGRLPPLASYEQWSDLVRSSLVWLGFADPVVSMAAARSEDPVRQQRARAFTAWRDEVGLEQGYTTAELIDLADARIRPNFHASLVDAAQKYGAPAGQIEPRRLGKWLTKHENTIASGLKLWVDRSDMRRPRYSMRGVGQ
jgi:putative DNA primase/helicase